MSQRLHSTVAGLLFVLLLALTAEPAPTAQDPLAAAPSKFAVVDGVRVHYKVLGQGGPTLVFVHGWSGDMTFWRLQVPAFTPRARVVLLDLPGHGRSDKPKVAYTMDLFARAVDAVLHDARAENATLVGHSMGALVVRQFYRLYPKKTRSLVTADGTLRPFFNDRAQSEQFISRYRGPDYKERVGEFASNMFSPGADPSLLGSAKAVMLQTPQYVLVSAMEGMMDPVVFKLDKITVPLGAVMADSPFWKDYEPFLRTLATTVDYRTITRVGHFPMLEKPSEFNAALADVLEAQGVLKK